MAGATLELRELCEGPKRVSAEVEMEGAAAHVRERREVSEGLRSTELPQREPLSGHGEVTARVRGEQHRDDVVRSTLVELPGGVEVARAERGGDGDVETRREARPKP
jgi:hypothetical protein